MFPGRTRKPNVDVAQNAAKMVTIIRVASISQVLIFLFI